MGHITIQSFTTKKPITMVGMEAGVCYGADTTSNQKNFTRGISCLESGHGRTFEFPDVYMVLDGYSSRVMREFYTHIGGAPTRLQASTRYINYQEGFEYVTPSTIQGDPVALKVYTEQMDAIQDALGWLEALGVPKEDSAPCCSLWA